eukprot:5847256-Alexandrium_andersonii.AAC.1
MLGHLTPPHRPVARCRLQVMQMDPAHIRPVARFPLQATQMVCITWKRCADAPPSPIDPCSLDLIAGCGVVALWLRCACAEPVVSPCCACAVVWPRCACAVLVLWLWRGCAAPVLFASLARGVPMRQM